MATAVEPRLPAAYRNQVAAADDIQAQLDAISAAQPPARDPFADVLAAPPATPPAPPTATPPQAPPPPQAQTSPQALSPEELRSIIETNRNVTEFINRQSAPPVAAPVAPQRPPSIMPEVSAPLNDDATKQLFGEDVLAMVDTKISRAMAPLIDAFRKIESRFNTVSTDVNNVTQRTALTAEQQMVQYLDTAVPNWKTVNKDQGWLQWLQETDPIHGEAKQAALDRAVAAVDGVRVAAIFKTYLSTLAPPAPPPQPNNAVETMVTPATVAAESPSAAPPATAATIFTSAQVQSFYNDLSKGKYRGREADAQKIAEAIDIAAAANRITR